jgi:mannose-6-phosphate isomerase-like protein (cupin superfamily)
VRKPLQIAETFVVMSSSFQADTVAVTENLYAELDQAYGDFAGRSLISSHTFSNDWPTWEVHPNGDEVVVLVSGAAEMVLAAEGGDETMLLNEAGQFVVVPKGVWHTAKISSPTQMMFITPGEGTENKEQPVRGHD